MRKLNQKGFTIIELLVVIVIIGILVALTLPNLFSAQARGRDTDRKNELKNVQTKLETFFNDNGRYPDDFAEAVSDADVTTEEQTGPRDDAYVYTPGDCDTASTNCGSYEIYAVLENDNDPDGATDSTSNEHRYTLSSVNE